MAGVSVVGLGKRVRIYVGQHDHASGSHDSLAQTLLVFLNREGAAGATLFRGSAGFGAHGRLHTARLADVAPDLPVVLEWIDGPERVDRLLPRIQEMVTSGVITVEDVEIVKYAHRAPRGLPPDRVGDVMTRDVMSVHPQTPLGEVVRILVDSDFRALPVVDDSGRLKGILTNGDLVARGGLPARLELLAELRPDALEQALARSGARDRTAESMLSPDLVSVREDESLARAAELMVERGVKRVPVVDEQDRLVGIISRVDILRTVGEDVRQPEGDPPHGRVGSIGELARHDVPTVGPDATLGEVIDAVTATRLNRAIVIDGDRKVIGVVRDAEVLARLDPGHRRGMLDALMGRTKPAADASTARDVMVTPPITIAADRPVGEAARLMTDARIKVLPVVDADGRLVGAVDRADLLRYVREQQA